MPRIPTINSEISATSLRTNNATANPNVNANAFGAAIGDATQSLAKGLSDLGNGIKAYQEKRQRETVANAVAQSDFTRRELELRNEVPANGEGYQRRVLEEYSAFVDEEAEKIDDDIARTDFKNRMLQQTSAISSRAAQYEFGISATYSKTQADASLMALENKVMSDPDMYDTYVQQGQDVIDTRTDINATVREGMKLQWRQDSANSRFKGMLERAASVEEIDAVAAELVSTEGKDWASEFTPGDFQRLTNLIGSTRKAFVTKADADARAALDTVEDRAKDINALIPQDELAAVQSVVKVSSNPITHARMARIVRDQEIIKESRNQNPAELRARINGANGTPNGAYPNLPARVSSAVNAAAERFGVSASYLGGTIQKEYGSNLRVKRSGDAKFAPQSVHSNVDMRNVNPEVLDAATVAGELFGAPLQVTSGHRTQAHQDRIIARGDPNRSSVAKKSKHTSGNALDIVTSGVSSEDKTRLVASLVDAGFTGIGEYDTHIHADFRNAVPASFGENENGYWGGWTYLSPEVAKVLQDKGFGSGVAATQIARSRAVATDEAVDYGKPTSVLKPDGTPASSAVGIMQFTDETFLSTLKTPGLAAKIGVDIEGKSDAELLALRKNPEVSIMAGAALAAQNKNTMTRTLGRGVSDPEIYMAHFLGAGGAVSLIKGYETQPEQSAAKLLPKAAANHKRLFYDGNRQKTVREVYNDIAVSFATEPTRVTHGDNETRKRYLEHAEKRLKEDPMAFAQETGTFVVSDLGGDNGFQNRGQEARAVADFYNVPVQDIKPFTEDEANSIIKRMKDGTVDDVLEMMTAIQGMGGDVGRAALKQLDQKDSVYAYAAGLQFERGQGSVASDIIRGQKRIEENPDIKTSVGAEARDLHDAFVKATGGALLEIAPRQRQAISDAALAHYIETAVAGGAHTSFDADRFGESVQAVLGGGQGAPAVGVVNGDATVLPQGVTENEMETAFARMTIDDWTRLSDKGVPPRYVTGELINPTDLADEARMRAVGNGKYKIMLADGSFAVTGNLAQNGRLEAYVFVPNEKEIDNIITRPLPQLRVTEPQSVEDIVDDDGVLTVEEQNTLRKNHGVLWNFDENGRWLGPVK